MVLSAPDKNTKTPKTQSQIASPSVAGRGSRVALPHSTKRMLFLIAPDSIIPSSKREAALDLRAWSIYLAVAAGADAALRPSMSEAEAELLANESLPPLAGKRAPKISTLPLVVVALSRRRGCDWGTENIYCRRWSWSKINKSFTRQLQFHLVLRLERLSAATFGLREGAAPKLKVVSV